MTLILVASLIALLLGVGIGMLVVRRIPCAAALAAAGLLAGAVIGLSASPILAATITALFSLAAAVLPAILNKESRPLPSVQWVGPVALFALLGVLGGITLRVNNLLHFRETSLRARLEVAGFTDHQVDRVMERWVSTIERGELDQGSSTALLRKLSGWQWHDLESLGLSDSALVEHVRTLGTNDERKFIAQLKREGRDAKEIVDALRTLYLDRSREEAP